MLRCFLAVLFAGAALCAAPRLESASAAQRMLGAIYAKGSAHTALLYRWEADLDNASGRWRSRYRTPNGALALEDEVVWKGPEFQRYSYVRQNTGESCSVERVGNKIVYIRAFGAAASERAEEDFEPNFMVGPTVLPYIQRHWAELMQGKGLRIRYGVPERLQSYGFEITLDRDHPHQAEPDAVVLRMRATSLFVRMAVDPMYMVWSKDGQILYEMSGRMMPVANQNGSTRHVEGDLVLTPQPLLGP